MELATEELPLSVEAWLRDHVPGYVGPGRITKFGFGQSNPTYRLDAASGTYVLRRKPFGTLLPKAHAIDREFHILSAIAGRDVPAPQPLAYCDDPQVIGAEFYVMEHVVGRIFYDQTLPGMSAAERSGIFSAMGTAVAALHSLDPVTIGLADFGRPEGFVARQVATWTRQYRASEGARIDAMERLIEWLPANLPPEQPGRIFHGDLRLDNMIFHPDEPRVVALLDWELSTVGDPFADFAYHAMAWRVPVNLFRGLADLDHVALGIPHEAAYVRSYCERRHIAAIPSWNFYLAFSLFRVAAILQGVRKRAQDGQASAADALDVGAKAAPLAEIGWRIASGPEA
ncbi:phosphotransferase family protein [Sphingobium sp. MK2]|uniref:phosphotransferase family protein n=1 Tax=Sphingobium sp. MK2 TaxID=3116540 RepID=UPI0032E3681E